VVANDWTTTAVGRGDAAKRYEREQCDDDSLHALYVAIDRELRP
jgi:hypothetical protein